MDRSLGHRIALCLVALLVIAGSQDEIRVGNVEVGEEWGVLIDGADATGAVDDRVAISSTDRIVLENLHSSTEARAEVVGFTRGRPMKLLEAAAWTPEETDSVQLDFSPEITLPVTVWVVATPFEELAQTVADSVATTLAVWRDERIGLRLEVEIVDVTGGFVAVTFSDFDCSKRMTIANSLGSRAGRFNVYWVETVNGSTYAGDSCVIGGGFVAMGRDVSDELLVHELGHGLGLEHVDGQDGFDARNVMCSASSMRAFLTEGQSFRAHADGISALNHLYNARVGEVTRTCPHLTSDPSCPSIGRRIWPDATPPVP
jgi:hypothetical protein